MGIVAGRCGHKEGAPPKDVISDQGYEHCMFDAVTRARRAADGINSVRFACLDPNPRLMCGDKKDPKASAANSGTVII